MSRVLATPMNNTAKILVYTSSADRIPNRKGGHNKTGTWIPEITHPLTPLYDAGYEFDFATPDGKPCVIDEGAKSLMHWRFSRRRRNIALEFIERLNAKGLTKPMKISGVLANHVLLNSYDALFIPGGHAPMTDVLHKNWIASNDLNEETGQLLQHFHDRGKPTALICHAPAALGAAPYVSGKWTYNGYTMTCVSMFADHLADLYTGGRPPDYPKRILERHGGTVLNSLLGRSFVVEDRELICAQDPFGGEELGEKLLRKIRRYVQEKAAKA
jgi:putative intracellular protease/amidase